GGARGGSAPRARRCGDAVAPPARARRAVAASRGRPVSQSPLHDRPPARRHGAVRRRGRLGARTLGFFWSTTLVAIVIGFLVAALVLPLASVTAAEQAALRTAGDADSAFVRRAAQDLPTGARFLVELIPANPVRAAVEGNLLPVIVFTTIFAVAAAALP